MSAITELDRSIADLRGRRQALINPAKLRTQVWVQRHGGPAAPRAPQIGGCLTIE
jgi:hypothetical protein